jgi:hypothetical protein
VRELQLDENSIRIMQVHVKTTEKKTEIVKIQRTCADGWKMKESFLCKKKTSPALDNSEECLPFMRLSFQSIRDGDHP